MKFWDTAGDGWEPDDGVAYDPASRPAQGVLCFTWDGCWTEVATLALPAASSRDQRHTIYQLSDWTDTAGKLTTAQIVSLASAGWEIGCHGKTNTDMTSLNATTRVAEWDTAKTALESIVGAGTVRHWSYPQGGLLNDACRSEGYLRYRTQRGFDANVLGTCITPLADVGTVQLLRALTWSNTKHQAVLDYIRYAAANPVAVVIRGGTIDVDDPSTGPSPAQMTEAFDLARSLNVPCLTVDEVFGNPLWHPDPGFEQGGSGWYHTGGGTFTCPTDAPMEGVNGTKSGLIDHASGASAFLVGRTPLTHYAQTHTLSFRYRIEDRGGSGNITATLQSVDALETKTGAASVNLTSTSWAQASVDATANATGRLMEASFSIPSTRDASLYLDHVHVGPKSLGAYG